MVHAYIEETTRTTRSSRCLSASLDVSRRLSASLGVSRQFSCAMIGRPPTRRPCQPHPPGGVRCSPKYFSLRYRSQSRRTCGTFLRSSWVSVSYKSIAFCRSPRQALFLCASQSTRAARMRRLTSLISAAPVSGAELGFFFAGLKVAISNRGVKIGHQRLASGFASGDASNSPPSLARWRPFRPPCDC